MKKERQGNKWNKELETLSRELAADRMAASFELVDNPYGRMIVPARAIKADIERVSPGNIKANREMIKSLLGDPSEKEVILPQAEEASEQSKTKPARERRPFRRCVQVFDPAAMDLVKEHAKASQGDVRRRIEADIKSAQANDGYRQIPNFRNIKRKLANLQRKFPNCAAVLEYLVGVLILSGVSKPESFHIAPILLNGPPGVGKTAIAQALAELLELPFRKISSGSMQHAFVLTGSDTHWGNSQSGEIFKMIGHSKSACGVIVLDEVDKISDRSDYAVLPALLDILEPESSKNFMDVSLGLTFDASRLFFILTCNDKGKLDPALLSRCLAFDIAAPGFEQKVMIAKGEHDNINKGLPRCRHLALDIQAVEKLAQANIDVRALIRAVRKGFTVAYTNGFKVAVPVLDAVTEVKKSRPIGFVWPELGMQNPPPKTDGGTLYCIGRAVNY